MIRVSPFFVSFSNRGKTDLDDRLIWSIRLYVSSLGKFLLIAKISIDIENAFLYASRSLKELILGYRIKSKFVNIPTIYK